MQASQFGLRFVLCSRLRCFPPVQYAQGESDWESRFCSVAITVALFAVPTAPVANNLVVVRRKT